MILSSFYIRHNQNGIIYVTFIIVEKKKLIFCLFIFNGEKNFIESGHIEMLWENMKSYLKSYNGIIKNYYSCNQDCFRWCNIYVA